MTEKNRIYRKAYGHTLKMAYVMIQQVANGLSSMSKPRECLLDSERAYLEKVQKKLNRDADLLFKLGNHLGA
jgi:hypothetical protein